MPVIKFALLLYICLGAVHKLRSHKSAKKVISLSVLP